MAKPDDLRYLYENHEDFQPLPTFFILPSLQAIFSFKNDDILPGAAISFEKLLHGEQYFEVMGELPHDGQLYSTCKIAEVLDKGSGAVIVYDGALFFCFLWNIYKKIFLF